MKNVVLNTEAQRHGEKIFKFQQDTEINNSVTP